MARTTRSQASSQTSPKAGTKRAAEKGSSPSPKRGKKSQKTIEETMPAGDEGEGDEMDGIEDDKNVAAQLSEDGEETEEENGVNEKALKAREEAVKKREDAADEKEKTGKEDKGNGEKDKEDTQSQADSSTEVPNGSKKPEKNAFDEVKSDTNDVHKAAKEEQDNKTAEISSNNDSVITDSTREATIPSSIMEKGIIYFFFRSRVNTENPQGIDDVARSYIVLRPLPIGAKIGDGPLQDDGKARLIALPKKMLPKRKTDRFLMFVERVGASIKDLREQFAGSEYATKTVGTSTQQAATPFAEGVYALTSTGRESHLAYSITYPEIGEIQEELGVNSKGSFTLSVKNPKAPGPANATIGNPAKYPESIQKKFRDLRWSPLEPEMLDYEGAQFLIMGEGMGDMGRAVEEQEKDKKDDEKDKPEEEMEKLEEEEHDRIEGLKEDDPVFADLGLSSKEYPKMQTTW